MAAHSIGRTLMGATSLRRAVAVALLAMAGCLAPGPDAPYYTVVLHQEPGQDWPVLGEEDLAAAPDLRAALDEARVAGEAKVVGGEPYDDALILLDNQVGSRTFVFQGLGYEVEPGAIR